MINEIKRRLENGEKVELECIEEVKFLNVNEGTRTNENMKILESGLAVEMVGGNNIYLFGCAPPIMRNEIQFFKIKEPKTTFDDLIDVALQAGKDGVLIGVRVDFDGVRCLRVEYSSGEHVDQIFDYHDDYSEYVERIKSRYTETFVIESEEDIKKFRLGAESIVLSNGEDIIDDVMFHRNEPYFTNGGVSAVKVGFNVLKGATVTQRKSKK